MELNVMERLMCQGLLPQEMNFTNLKLVRKAREALSFTEEENRVLNFKTIGKNGEQIKWEDGRVGEVEIELGEVVTTMIVDALKKLNDGNKLTENHFSLYKKFVRG